MVDTLVLGTSAFIGVRVRVLSSAQKKLVVERFACESPLEADRLFFVPIGRQSKFIVALASWKKRCRKGL